SLRSIRSKLVLLVVLVAAIVGGVSAIYDLRSSNITLREQMVKRGRYIATNLAYNSKYGVLTEDKPLLTQFLEGAVSVNLAEGTDVVGAMVRDAKGSVLASKGAAIQDLPPLPAGSIEEKDAATVAGEPVLLFRAPVTTSTSGAGGDMAAELGISAADAKKGDDQKGGVEVAISKKVMLAQRDRRIIETILMTLGFVAAGAAGGWVLIGRWFRPLQHMVEVSSAVAKGDLREGPKVETDDEMGVLGTSLGEMVANLRRIVDNIQEPSVQLPACP